MICKEIGSRSLITTRGDKPLAQTHNPQIPKTREEARRANYSLLIDNRLGIIIIIIIIASSKGNPLYRFQHQALDISCPSGVRDWQEDSYKTLQQFPNFHYG